MEQTKEASGITAHPKFDRRQLAELMEKCERLAAEGRLPTGDWREVPSGSNLIGVTGHMLARVFRVRPDRYEAFQPHYPDTPATRLAAGQLFVEELLLLETNPATITALDAALERIRITAKWGVVDPSSAREQLETIAELAQLAVDRQPLPAYDGEGEPEAEADNSTGNSPSSSPNWTPYVGLRVRCPKGAHPLLRPGDTGEIGELDRLYGQPYLALKRFPRAWMPVSDFEPAEEQEVAATAATPDQSKER